MHHPYTYIYVLNLSHNPLPGGSSFRNMYNEWKNISYGVNLKAVHLLYKYSWFFYTVLLYKYAQCFYTEFFIQVSYKRKPRCCMLVGLLCGKWGQIAVDLVKLELPHFKGIPQQLPVLSAECPVCGGTDNHFVWHLVNFSSHCFCPYDWKSKIVRSILNWYLYQSSEGMLYLHVWFVDYFCKGSSI